MQLRRCEVVTVVLLIGLGILILIGHRRYASESAAISMMRDNGRNMIQLLYVRAMYDSYEEGTRIYELQLNFRRNDPDHYANSTEVFRDWVRSGFVVVSFDFFGGAGVPIYTGRDPEGFLPENNAWNIVTFQDSMHETAPVLFTRNLGMRSLDGDFSSSFTDQQPFGKRRCVVVTKGGASFVMTKDNHKAWSPGTYTNTVLFPDSIRGDKSSTRHEMP